MKKNKTGRTDEINIGKEGYSNERVWLYSIYDEDTIEKAQKGSILPATEGSFAAPSRATKDKFYSEKRHRAEHKRIPQCYAILTVGGLEDTLQYDSDLHPVTDYHEAMMDNIEKMHEGDPVWTFKNQTKIQRKLDMYSFVYVQQIREFYNLDKKNTYYIEDLEEIIEEYGKTLPTPLALRILALEQSDKEWFKGYMPSSMYKAIKKQLCKSLDLADKDYITKGGKDPAIRKKALESTIKEIRL